MRERILALLMLLILLAAVPFLVSATHGGVITTTLDLSVGATFTNTAVVQSGVILKDTEDTFATDPFSAPARWTIPNPAVTDVFWLSTAQLLQMCNSNENPASPPVCANNPREVFLTATSTWTEANAFIMSFDFYFDEDPALTGSVLSVNVGMFAASTFRIGMVLQWVPNSNCFRFFARIDGGEAGTNDGTTTACTVPEVTTNAGEITYRNDVLTVTIATLSSTVTRSGQTYTATRPGLNCPIFNLCRWDNVRSGTFTTGTWASASQTLAAEDAIASVDLTFSDVDGTEFFTQVTVRDSVGTARVTYDTDITSGTSLTISSPTSGAFELVALSYTIRVEFVGDGTLSPTLTGVTVTTGEIHPASGGSGGQPTETTGGGITGLLNRIGGAGFAGRFVPGLDSVCMVSPVDWLLTTPVEGHNEVSIYDGRVEAVQAILYVVTWGDKTQSIEPSTPINHTYKKDGIYKLTVRIQYNAGQIDVFTTSLDTRGNNCALQMFARDYLGIIMMLGVLSILAAVIVTVSRRRIIAKKRKTLRRALLYLGIFSLVVGIIVVAYATAIGTPI